MGVLLLLHQGLRRGELLQLAIDAVKDEFDRRLGRRRFWLNVAENPHERLDPRVAVPRLKNDLAPRQIPISEAHADVAPSIIRQETMLEGREARTDALGRVAEMVGMPVPMIERMRARYLASRASQLAARSEWEDTAWPDEQAEGKEEGAEEEAVRTSVRAVDVMQE